MVQILANRRIVLDPAPRRATPPPMEAVLFGHCPGRVRPGRLSQYARERLAQLGFAKEAEALPLAATQPGLDDTAEVSNPINDNSPLSSEQLFAARVQQLHHLPLAFASLADFTDCFPDADSAACAYTSQLAGASAWLPSAVEDFFRAGGRLLWVIVVGENEGQRGFLPRAGAVALSQPTSLRGFELLGLLTSAALVAVPDLERLQIPATLPPPPRMQLPNPEPLFLPCADNSGDHNDPPQERRSASDMLTAPQPLPFTLIARHLLTFLARWRTDMQLLLTAPLHFSDGLERPALDHAAVSAIGDADDTLLRHLQPLFPYLRDTRHSLSSATGLIAGAICASAAQISPWASIAGKRLACNARPYPEQRPLEIARLREEFNLGVIIPAAGGVVLDDERTPCQTFQLSAEIVRFVGWLRRQLNELGNDLVFSVDPHDPRPELALRHFFTRLHQAGALRGRTSEEAFSLEVTQPGEGQVIFTILIAPAFPIDRITLTLVADRGQWSVANG